MKPSTSTEKIDLIENCIELGGNLEDVTRKKLQCPIGWIEDGFMDLKISLIINHKTAWFICDNNEKMTISSDVIRNRINKFHSYDDVYLHLNDLIDRAYKLKI